MKGWGRQVNVDDEDVVGGGVTAALSFVQEGQLRCGEVEVEVDTSSLGYGCKCWSGGEGRGDEEVLNEAVECAVLKMRSVVIFIGDGGEDGPVFSYGYILPF